MATQFSRSVTRHRLELARRLAAWLKPVGPDAAAGGVPRAANRRQALSGLVVARNPRLPSGGVVTGALMPGPQLLEDEIGRQLREAEQNGELRAAKGYGQPLAVDAGWEQTPDAWRLPFKILKDAGVVPPEVELMQQRAALREQLAACNDPAQAEPLRQQLVALELSLALRMEAVRGGR